MVIVVIVAMVVEAVMVAAVMIVVPAVIVFDAAAFTFPVTAVETFTIVARADPPGADIRRA